MPGALVAHVFGVCVTLLLFDFHVFTNGSVLGSCNPSICLLCAHFASTFSSVVCNFVNFNVFS